MAAIHRRQAEADAAMAEAMAAASRPRGCPACGRTFLGQAAWTLHWESAEGSRCLPDERLEGTLEKVDGVWRVFRPGTARD